MEVQFRSAKPFVLLVINAVLGSLFFGYSISYLNSASKSYPTYYKITDYDQGTQNLLKALVSAIYTLSAGLGAMSSGTLLFYLSIRKSFMVTDCIGIVGALLQMIPNIYIFYVARILIGICVGLNSSLVPQYIKEFSPSKLSGALGALNQLTINVGILIGLISAFSYKTPVDNEKTNNDFALLFFFDLPSLFCLLRTILLVFVFKNEPPSYYVKQNDTNQAKCVLQQYYEDSEVFKALDKIKQQNEEKTQQNEKFGDLFKVPDKRKRLLIGCGLQILQQFSGINAIMFFSSIIFSSILNNDELKINWANIGVGLINILFSFIALGLLQKFGRRPLLLYGTLQCTIFLAIAFAFSFQDDPISAIEILIVLAIFGYLAAFQLSLGPVAWIYDADILSEKGMSLAVLCNWLSATIIAFVFVILDIENNHSRLPIVFGAFTGFCVAGILFIYSFVKETKDHTATQIHNMFTLVNAG